MNQADYPGIWVNYDDTDELTIAGIGHTEYVEVGDALVPVTRWRFAGTVTLTAAALSSLERDRLFDEMVKVLAFARYKESISEFRNIVEGNDLVAMNANFDKLRPSGDNAAPGTPWNTDEMIYEKSISLDLIGEFVSEPDTLIPVPLRLIKVFGYQQGTPEHPFTGESEVGLDHGLPGSTPQGFEVDVPNDWL